MIQNGQREDLGFYPKFQDKTMARYIIIRAWPKSGYSTETLGTYRRNLVGLRQARISNHWETEARYRAHLAALEAHEPTRGQAAKLRDEEARNTLHIRIADKALSLKSLEPSRAATQAVCQIANTVIDTLRRAGPERVARAALYNPNAKEVSRAKPEDVRATLAALKAEEERARGSIMPEADAWSRIRVDLEQARDRGLPKVSVKAGLAPTVAWPSTFAQGYGKGGVDVVDARAVAAALHFDELAAHLKAALGREYARLKANGVAIMTGPEKAAALAKIAGERHRALRLEAEVVWREVEASGGIFPAWTRPDMAADHVLGIEF